MYELSRRVLVSVNKVLPYVLHHQLVGFFGHEGMDEGCSVQRFASIEESCRNEGEDEREIVSIHDYLRTESFGLLSS